MYIWGLDSENQGFLFRSSRENFRGQHPVPEGRRPEEIFLPRTKITEVETAIMAGIAQRDPIHLICASHIGSYNQLFTSCCENKRFAKM